MTAAGSFRLIAACRLSRGTEDKALVASDEIGTILLALSARGHKNAYRVGPEYIIQRSGFNVVHRRA